MNFGFSPAHTFPPEFISTSPLLLGGGWRIVMWFIVAAERESGNFEHMTFFHFLFGNHVSALCAVTQNFDTNFCWTSFSFKTPIGDFLLFSGAQQYGELLDAGSCWVDMFIDSLSAPGTLNRFACSASDSFHFVDIPLLRHNRKLSIEKFSRNIRRIQFISTNFEKI